MIAKSGVEKLVQFYASDPVAQRKAEDELAEAERKVKALQDGTYSTYMVPVSPGIVPPPSMNLINAGTRRARGLCVA